MDYANRRRVKLWGTARVVEDDPELMRRLTVEGYRGRPEQVIVFTLEAWDINCPQHIPQMVFAEDIMEAVDKLKERIAQLEQEKTGLCAAQGKKEERGEA
jgi:predicted pyridoxine 5'-phosphate oxidase superfamily flavin-nucleotide-binding protein